MNHELEILANKQLEQLNWLVDLLRIPDEIIKHHLCSGFSMTMYEIEGGRSSVEFEKSNADFDKLCLAAPHVSKECLKMLSLAYTTMIFFFEVRSDEQSISSGAQMLITAATANGAAVALLPPALGHLSKQAQAKNKQLLSEAGRKEAAARNKATNALKDWAIGKASSMQGSDKGIARKLELEIPPELINVSIDPQRLIYEALRSRRSNTPS